MDEGVAPGGDIRGMAAAGVGAREAAAGARAAEGAVVMAAAEVGGAAGVAKAEAEGVDEDQRAEEVVVVENEATSFSIFRVSLKTNFFFFSKRQKQKS